MGNGIVPTKQQELINFFGNRLAIWQQHVAILGLQPADVTALAALVSSAQDAFNAAEVARNASKAATLTLESAIAALRELGGDYVKTIRTRAETTGNTAIYTLANLPAPAKPAPLGPAETPTDLTTTLTTGGSVELSWRGSRTGGTSFRIYRSIKTPDAEPTSFELLGTSEERRFVDTNLPTGLQNATYYVVAVRSGGPSAPSDVSTLFFGTAAGNPVTQQKKLTIAA